MADVLAGVVDDRDPQAILDAELAVFAGLAPDAQLRNGSLEVILLEAVAVAAADVIYAANRIAPTVVEAILDRFDIAPDAGQPATGQVILDLDGINTPTIAAGTRLQDSTTGVILIVAADTTATSPDTVTAPVRAAVTGAIGNTIPANALLDVLDIVPDVIAARLDGSLTGGSDPESTEAWRARAGARLKRVTSSLSLPEHFTAYCAEDIRVSVATSIDNWNSADPATIGADIGHVTTVIHGRTGTLAPIVLDELRTAMHAMASSMVTVHAIPATLVSLPIALTVHAIPGTDQVELAAAVEAALRAWITPSAWTFGEPLRVTEIITAAAGVPGVDYVATITTPAADVYLDEWELAEAGTITVTVT